MELGALPALREDLKLIAAASSRDGSPAWMIQDAVGNRFFRIGWLEFELLSRWDLGNPLAIVLSVNRETTLSANANNVKQLQDFLQRHQLLRVSNAAGTMFLARLAQAKQQAFWQWLLHNYLFIRLPLVRPARFLQATQWCLAPLFTRTFFWLIVAIAVLGVFLVGRQWDSFAHTFVDMLSPAGFLGYALALMFAKTLHELGHAYTATRYGVRVAHMGVAFLVMLPMLYTDTGESWKLQDRMQRWRIAAAGMSAEFALAAVATLGWSLTSDGPLRSTLFFLATTSWLVTLAINASPFMRFDGYFLLSDALDFPNLHERAGALARSSMRRTLLGWQEPDPEPVSSGMRRSLVGFAYFTWLYRLTVFLGIAVAVYVFFFKILGIFLFLVEIAWFVVRPFYNEMKQWPARANEIKWSRWFFGFLLLAGLLAVLFVPWQRSVHAQSWAHAQAQQLVYSPVPARLVSLRSAGPVKAGDVIAVLDSPDVRSRASQSAGIASALALQLDQTIGKNDGHERRAVISEQLAQQLAETRMQQAELERLELRAAFDGVLLDQDSQAQPGVWLNASQALAVLVAPKLWVAEGLVEQSDIERVAVGDQVRFYRRGQITEPLQGVVLAVDSTRTQTLPHPMLSTEHGGRVAVLKPQNGVSPPRDALYRVHIQLTSAAANTSVMLGTAVIAAKPRSVGLDWMRSIAAVLVRESGF
jgi:putative peptide zinc metalloprotease protein